MSANGKAAVQIQPGSFRLVPTAGIKPKELFQELVNWGQDALQRGSAWAKDRNVFRNPFLNSLVILYQN